MATTSPKGIIACSIILPIISIIVVSWRFYVRDKQQARLEFDDWAHAPALILFLGMAMTALLGVNARDFGHLTPPLPIADEASHLTSKPLFAITVLQIPALALTKCTALYIYRRMFCPYYQPGLNRILWALIAIVVGWAFALLVTCVTLYGTHQNCSLSVQASFNCHKHRNGWGEAFAVSDLTLNVVVLALPTILCSKLQMSTSQILGIITVFVFAFVGFGASVARLIVTVYSGNANTIVNVQTDDIQAVWLSMIEIGVSLIALNLPSLWALPLPLSLRSALSGASSLLSRQRKAPGRFSRPYTELNDTFEIHRGLGVHDGETKLAAQIATSEVAIGMTGDSTTEVIVYSCEARDDLESGIYIQKSISRTETRLNTVR